MSRHAKVLVTAALLLPLVCQAEICNADCQEDEMSLVQIKAAVNLGNDRSEIYPQSGRQHSMVIPGSRGNFGELDSLGSQEEVRSSRPGGFSYSSSNHHMDPSFGHRPSSHSSNFGSSSSRHSESSRSKGLAHGPTMDEHGSSPSISAPQENIPQPSPDFAAMLGGKAGAIATAADSAAVSDNSADMLASGDGAFVAQQMAKNKALVDNDQAEKNAYSAAVNTEQSNYAKYQKAQKDWYDNRTAGQRKWFEDKNSAVKAYVEKQQMGVKSYVQAQQQAAAMMADAKQSVMQSFR